MKNLKCNNERGVATTEWMSLLFFIAFMFSAGMAAFSGRVDYGFFRMALCFGGGTDIIAGVAPVNQCLSGIGVLNAVPLED